MYRPFVTCDDPEGVVECGSIRKYRSSSSNKMKDKTGSRRRTVETLETATSLTNKPGKEGKFSKGSAERSFDPSSLQLGEVSRGAQRLENMIESWSGTQRYEGSSEDMAKDLLKGALDLQESLAMLRKVQEASHMARLKRKQYEKPERSRIDSRLIDRTAHSNQFGEQSYPVGGCQRPWSSSSAEASSSNCTEELKKVIRESLVKQNLLPNKTTGGFDSASVSAFPSTSSSQSSGVWYDRLSDSSPSPTTLKNSKKERGPNLVAKLMGLEEVSSRPFPAEQKQLSQKILNQKRPVFEIDTPKVRNNSSVFENVSPEPKMTLREILETNNFNRLLNKSPVREHKLHVHHSNYPYYKQFDDLPPIVLMKPRYNREFAKPYEPLPPEELPPFRNLKANAVPFPSRTFKHREVFSSTKMEKEMDEYVSKRLAKEERPNRLKEVVEVDVKEIKPVENEKAPGGKVKLSSHAGHKSQASETIDRKASVKTITIIKKLPEKEVSKPKVMVKPQDQGEVSSTSAKLRKPQSRSIIDKNEIPSRKSTASNLNTTSKSKNRKVYNSKEQKKIPMKKQRSVAEPEAAKPIDVQLGHEEEGKIIDVSCEDGYTDIRVITTVTEDLAKEREIDDSANKTIVNCDQSQSSSGDDALMLRCELQNDAYPAEETDCKPDKDCSELRYLLLTSQSFISHAEEFLNVDADCPKILPKIGTNGIANSRLYLDCANELTERKSHQESQQVAHPLLLTCGGNNSRLHISFGRLVDEIYNAIENLSCYCENPGKKLLLDNVYAMMERDMKCSNGLINGIWNWGWRHGFSADEAEQVVSEVGNLVLIGLIEEVIVNL